MESVESPLDVLSRAATMVQDSLPSSPEESTKQASTKQLPTTKWKRDRRRLPEYSRKSDPKLAENTPPELQRARAGSPETGEGEAPIDMSVRQRGLPPSYTQAISSPGYRTGFRPSVITQAPTPASPTTSPEPPRSAARAELPSGISMCDPIIDEHFRRSLGKDYLMLFNNNKSAEQAAPKSPGERAPSGGGAAVRELLDMDTTGLSVDEHFAKALGDTWLKLNQKEPSTGPGAADKPTVVSL